MTRAVCRKLELFGSIPSHFHVQVLELGLKQSCHKILFHVSVPPPERKGRLKNFFPSE